MALRKFIWWGSACGWCELCGVRVIDWRGDVVGYTNPKGADRKAYRLQEMDWSYLVKPDSPFGWISKDGTFYRCAAEDVDLVGFAILDVKDFSCRDEDGLIEIRSDTYGLPYVICPSDLTEAQSKTLWENGIMNSYEQYLSSEAYDIEHGTNSLLAVYD